MPMLVRMPGVEAEAEVSPQTAQSGKSIRLNEATLTSFQLDGG